MQIEVSESVLLLYYIHYHIPVYNQDSMYIIYPSPGSLQFSKERGGRENIHTLCSISSVLYSLYNTCARPCSLYEKDSKFSDNERNLPVFSGACENMFFTVIFRWKVQLWGPPDPLRFARSEVILTLIYLPGFGLTR